MRVLIDTCVIIDALQARAPFAEAAQKIFLYAANKQFEGYLTAKAATDIYYLTHRLTHSDAETRKILSKLYTLFNLLDTASLDCRKAISSEIGDYEDAVMVETAIRSEMDCIVTRNMRDYAKSSVTVYEPSVFLELLEAERESD
ncbi:MAG: PIN domain-containing protein [Roseburia sp.]|nr:PIN domain-containing protein [Roseburia sp.]